MLTANQLIPLGILVAFIMAFIVASIIIIIQISPPGVSTCVCHLRVQKHHKVAAGSGTVSPPAHHGPLPGLVKLRPSTIYQPITAWVSTRLD